MQSKSRLGLKTPDVYCNIPRAVDSVVPLSDFHQAGFGSIRHDQVIVHDWW
jgi:hypothetical protein